MPASMTEQDVTEEKAKQDDQDNEQAEFQKEHENHPHCKPEQAKADQTFHIILLAAYFRERIPVILIIYE